MKKSKSERWEEVCNIIRSRHKKADIAISKFKEVDGKDGIISLIHAVQYRYHRAMIKLAEKKLLKLSVGNE